MTKQASTIACLSSAMLEQLGSTHSSRLTRHVERVKSCRDMTNQVEVGLIPAVLVSGPTATENSPFLPQRWRKPSPVLMAPIHRGMARLSGRE